ARLRPILRPHLRAAPRAGDLRVAVFRAPRSQQLFALHDPQRAGRRAARDRSGVPRPPLTPGAMAIAGADERLADLVANPAAHAPAGEHRRRLLQLAGAPRSRLAWMSPSGDAAIIALPGVTQRRLSWRRRGSTPV